MKRIAILAFLLPFPALAQQAPDPEKVALVQELQQAMGDKVALRAEVVRLSAELAKMKETAKPADPPTGK